MNQAIYSPQWYRVADLRPAVPPHVRIQRQFMRGQPWYLLINPTQARQMRLNANAYHFIGLCDGQRSVQQIWDHLTRTLGETAPTQGEVIHILGRLANAGLLQAAAESDVETMFEGHAQHRRRKNLARLNPLALRVSLLNPSRLLERADPWSRWVFSPWGLTLWLLLLAWAGLGVVSEWTLLVNEVAAITQSPRVLLSIWLAYPCIKLIHELAHGLAVRRWGGEVNDMGLTLMVLMPVPWVDASAASSFPHRHQRFVVSAAGIMAELAIAAIAFFVWRHSQPGLLHDAALVVMLIGGVSTVLFNGNPLLRFDGYYMLCDALGMPNLAPRSTAWWGYLAKRYFLRIPAQPPHRAPGERLWLLLYGPASLGYRIFVSLLILSWLAQVSRWLFVIAAMSIAWMLVIKPGRNIIRAVWDAPASPSERRRARGYALGALFAGILALAVVPVPVHTTAGAVVWLPENSHIRIESEGFVVRVHARDGEPVRSGQRLVSLDDPFLLAEQHRLKGQWEALEAQRAGSLIVDAAEAKTLADEMASLAERIRVNAERIEQLEVRAKADGTLILPHAPDLPGRFVQKGEALGYILPAQSIRVRAVLPQQDAERVRTSLRSVEVWLAEYDRYYPARVRATGLTAAGRELPHPALGDRAGGPIPVDPKDPSGKVALEPFFAMDFDLPNTRVQRIGGRALVRMHLGYEPLLQQMWRQARQVFLYPETRLDTTGVVSPF